VPLRVAQSIKVLSKKAVPAVGAAPTVGEGVCVAVSELPARGAGRGLFVTETEVDAGDIITGYDGTVLTAAEARRYKPSQCTHASPA
jgi:hypothetical protein